jgi:type III secretion protein L
MDEKIIKARSGADGRPSVGSRILRKDVYEAGLGARELLDAAAQNAQALIEDAQRQQAATLESARQEGFRHGLAEWDSALAGVRRAEEALDARYEPELIRLAVKIAEKIIGEELRLRPETVVSIVRECLRGIRHEHSLTLRVAPADREVVERQLGSLNDSASGRRIQVRADPEVSQGGCIVESVAGAIDARFQTQLACLEEILLHVAVRP